MNIIEEEVYSKMGDLKNIRVDNWGMFFLQRLQQFFNKTDYCDLTLQFHDNSQLKVHRLVLNACTEYFTVLERNCEMIDDCLIMPMDLQADVVVPIVNFMYTGQLEFRYSLLDRLQATAQIMNIAILTKLLKAQKMQQPSANKPVLLNHQNPIVSMTYNLQGRNIIQKMDNEYSVTGQKTWKKQPATSYSLESPSVEPIRVNRTKLSMVDNSPRPTRFEAVEVANDSIFETSFDNISYESKPLSLPKLDNNLTESRGLGSSNSFEELRKGCVQKRPAPTSPTSSEPKRVNLQDVKEYVEAHRLRANYEMEEIEDDPDDDNYHDNGNDDYDSGNDDENVEKQSGSQETSGEPSGQIIQNVKIDSQKATINLNQDSSANHARIISEVLKKYPHLVKNNRNIKLKVVQQRSAPGVTKLSDNKVVVGITKDSSSNNIGKVISHKVIPSNDSVLQTKVDQPKIIDAKKMHALLALGAENKTGPWLCLRCGTNGRPISFPSYPVFRKHLVRVHEEKIDIRICEHCGHKSTKRNYLYFHLYTKHGIKPPSSMHFPKCNHCNYIALNDALLAKHKMNHTKLSEFVCNQCTAWFKTKQGLITHMAQTGHKIGPSTKESQQCIYCNKLFLREANMYAHVRSVHKEQARNDGIIELSDHEEKQYDETSTAIESIDTGDRYMPNNPQLQQQKGKIKIWSNIALPNTVAKDVSLMLASGQQAQVTTATLGQQIIGTDNIIIQNAMIQSLEPSSEAEALNNVASGIATSLGLVDSIVVMDNHYELSNQNTDDNQDKSQYIVNQMNLEEIPEENVTESLPDHSALVHGNETSLGQVQTEIQTGLTTTKIITQGDVLKLTESQQNEIINELQNSNHLTSQNNVVMVLTEDQFKQVKQHQIQNDENIYVVYSQASQVDVNEKQYLQIGESEELLEENSALCNTLEQGTIDDDIDNNINTNVAQNQDQWPEETVEMISEELRKQIETDKSPPPLMLKNDCPENSNQAQSYNVEEELSQAHSNSCVEDLLHHETNIELTANLKKDDSLCNNITESKYVSEHSLETNYNESWSGNIQEVQEECEIKEQNQSIDEDEIKQISSNEQVISEMVQENITEIEEGEQTETIILDNTNTAVVTSSETNKISNLLDDWDDNDSQGEKNLISDKQTQEKPIATSDPIHKLMDDWTEEDTAMEM